MGTTAYRHVTYSHLLLYAAYGMLAFVVTQTLRRSSQFELLAKLFTGYGAVVASFAVLQGLAPNGKLYWIWALEQGGSIYGPYVNHNHYAGLMEMLTPFPLVLAATRFTDGNRKLAVAGIAALMAGSIFLSGSRGGMAAFVAQMVVLGVLLVRKREGSWKQPLMLGAFLAMVIVFLVWMGGNELTQRLISIHSEAREEISGGVRLTIDRDCLRMLVKRPFLGWGLGAFPIVYPEFRSFYTTFFVNQAHNDYLQLLVETGLAGFSIAVWFLVLVFRQAAGKLKNWTETASGALTMAAAARLRGDPGAQLSRFQSADPGKRRAVLRSLRDCRLRAAAGIAAAARGSPAPFDRACRRSGSPGIADGLLSACSAEIRSAGGVKTLDQSGAGHRAPAKDRDGAHTRPLQKAQGVGHPPRLIRTGSFPLWCCLGPSPAGHRVWGGT